MGDYFYKQKYGKKGNVKYISEEIPDFEVPEYKGEHYRAMVPDTLDLQDIAEWGVNGLTSSNNPDANYEAYWGTEFGSNPPRMANGFDGGFCQMKYLESLPLLRIASGSTQNQAVNRLRTTGKTAQDRRPAVPATAHGRFTTHGRAF